MVATLVGGVAALWVHAPALYASTPVEHGRAQAVALTRTGVLTAGAALLALAGVLANLLENRRANNLTHARELAEQLADRYTAAITQLGSDTLDVRLGGIYALEQIAIESEAHHGTVVEVLSAFVRERTTPGRPGAGRRSRHTAALPTPADRAAGTAARTPAGPDTDIQAVLTVLGRLPARDGIARADLSGARLTGAVLSRANLSGARLGETNLTGARLGETNLTGAELGAANLSGAQLTLANLTEARLHEANLSGANLYLADLAHARLYGTNLTDARGLTQEQLGAARGDRRTVLPMGLTQPGHWPTPTWSEEGGRT